MNVTSSNTSIFNKYIKPLEDFQNNVTATNNIRLDQVVASLDAFKSAIYNVNYLTSLVNANTKEIVQSGEYASVLKPIIEKQYYNKDDNFWINRLSPDLYVYINNKYPFWNNLSLNEIIDYNSKHNLEDLNNIIIPTYPIVLKYANDLKQKYPKNTSYYYFSVLPWENSLSLKINYFLPDLLNNNNLLSIGGRILLGSNISGNVYISDYISNTNDLTTFSPEYLNFINDLANEIAILNGNDWQVDAIWPYADPSKFERLDCLYSSQYPEWTGKLISQCFIPGSTIDIPTTIYAIMVDLFFNYPSLAPGQIAMSTYNLGDVYYVALLKIDMHNGELCFKQKSIEINKYFISTSLSITNDVTINGSLNVKTYDGEDIIKTNNITKTTSFHTKIGVNQDLSKVKGLIDVDNLSNNTVLNMMNDFVDPLLYSYAVTMDIKDKLTYGATSVSIPPTYQENVFVFKTPIQNVIQSTDISFLYLPSAMGVFTTQTFEQISFTKIQAIVNELNKMSPEMELNVDTQSFLFSFVELLSDTKNYYLCSLRGVVKRNPNNLTKEIYFICSFLNVNDKIINQNQKPYMIALTDKFSSCCRLLNYSNLLVLDKKIQENLFKGQSISMSTDTNSPYFSDRINNNPFFRDRFGGKDLYIFCNEYLTNEQLLNTNTTIELLSELLPYQNNKQANTLLQPNTDVSVFTVTKNRLEYYNNLYGSNKSILSFVTNYDWVKGTKISFENIANIQNKKYVIGCGINLTDVLDETIISKGDNKITGNFAILDDTTNVPVFSVNREKKQTSSVFHTGIGTTNPQTMLDINDCGVTDIINVINKMAMTYNLLNYNMQGLINALKQSEESAAQYIKNSFKDPVTGKEVNQDINTYFALNKIPDNLNAPDITVLYNWLYQNWQNNTFQQLLDTNKNDKQAITFAINAQSNFFNNNNIFNLSNCIEVVKWVAGIKTILHRLINVNNKFYYIGTGVNLQQYVTYESNSNIQKFFTCLQSYNYQLQDIIIRHKMKNNTPISQILNQQNADDVRYQYAQQYPIQTLVQYTLDLNTVANFDIKNVKLTYANLDYKTLEPINSIKLQDILDENLLAKISIFFYRFRTYYTNINQNDYGILSFEDKYSDHLSLFWCASKDLNVVTLFSLEMKLNSIILPSLTLKGDLQVKGDTYFHDGSSNYLYIDPQNKFIGVNSLEILNKYQTSIQNINYSTLNLSKQNMVVSSSLYPNFVAERIPVGEIVLDNTGKLVPNIKSGFFTAVAGMTIRRTSNNYSFQQMYDYSKIYTSQYIKPNPDGFISMLGTSTPTNPVYTKYIPGPSFVYEIKDNTGATNIIGRNYMGIDKIINNVTKAGFGIQVNDLDNGSNYRDLLYVNNDSQLYVNSIMLGGKILEVDGSGNLLFDKKNVTLN